MGGSGSTPQIAAWIASHWSSQLSNISPRVKQLRLAGKLRRSGKTHLGEFNREVCIWELVPEGEQQSAIKQILDELAEDEAA